MIELEFNLRMSDRVEVAYVQSATRSAIFPQLRERIETDSYYTFFRGNEVICVGGITPAKGYEENEIGIIWLMGTSLADIYWREMTRMCRNFLMAHCLFWDKLTNIVPADQEKRIKWLKHLGFDIEKEKAHISGHEFVHFYMDTSQYGPDNR